MLSWRDSGNLLLLQNALSGKSEWMESDDAGDGEHGGAVSDI